MYIIPCSYESDHVGTRKTLSGTTKTLFKARIMVNQRHCCQEQIVKFIVSKPILIPQNHGIQFKKTSIILLATHHYDGFTRKTIQIYKH